MKNPLTPEFREYFKELYFACKGNPVLLSVLFEAAAAVFDHYGDEILSKGFSDYVDYLDTLPDPTQAESPSQSLV